jgi:hypothetical protein
VVEIEAVTMLCEVDTVEGELALLVDLEETGTTCVVEVTCVGVSEKLVTDETTACVDEVLEVIVDDLEACLDLRVVVCL